MSFISRTRRKSSLSKEYANYLTYKHRKTSIAGGELEDMDFETDTPEKGYLSYYREEREW